MEDLIDTTKTEKKRKKLPPTDDVIKENLVEAFSLLSSMLEEAKKSKENLEKIYEIVLNLLKTVEELKEVGDEFAKVNQIVEEINVLVKAVSVNNANIKDLIEVIYKIAEGEKKNEKEIESIKNEIFFRPEEKNKENGSNFALTLILAINGGIFFLLLLIFLRLKGIL